MRRMSETDIVIDPRDRLAASEEPPRPARKARSGERPAARASRVPRATSAARRFTPLQKAAALALAVLAAVAGIAALWHSGAPQRAAQAAVDGMLALTARGGLRIETIAIGGRNRTADEQISTALGAHAGDPIFALDIHDAKERLEALPTVRAASIERRLPGNLRVEISERQPVALWQHDGTFVLVDRDGHRIPGPIEGFEDLLLVVGDGAPSAAGELLTMLATEPVLSTRVKSAVRVGNRRWDLHLDNAATGMEARLPEDDPTPAWHRLAELERERALSQKHVTMVDLRLADRLVVRTGRDEAAAEQRKDNGA